MSKEIDIVVTDIFQSVKKIEEISNQLFRDGFALYVTHSRGESTKSANGAVRMMQLAIDVECSNLSELLKQYNELQQETDKKPVKIVVFSDKVKCYVGIYKGKVAYAEIPFNTIREAKEFAANLAKTDGFTEEYEEEEDA